MQDSTIPRASLATVPQAMPLSIGFKTFDLRPFGPTNVTPTMSIGLIYLIIIALFNFHPLFHAIFNRRKSDTFGGI